jgi:hypothetical protein
MRAFLKSMLLTKRLDHIQKRIAILTRLHLPHPGNRQQTLLRLRKIRRHLDQRPVWEDHIRRYARLIRDILAFLTQDGKQPAMIFQLCGFLLPIFLDAFPASCTTPRIGSRFRATPTP